ncbi:carboxyl transferase domain-containing protein [Pseudofrankia sp. DC12]|uniref:carboxyl transferase domain-containing protein n=1 Tax=Pseudofrankia sp. DC12 TaxID=683315 RepID=UPI000A00CEDD|nr:carboxyl transferase domain-containing protein [Pseudofrankia sp. DC12]
MTDRHPPSADRRPERGQQPRPEPAQDRAPAPADWRTSLLAAVTPRPPAPPAPNRLDWPDYTGRPAVWWGDGPVAGVHCVVAVWEFSVYGGSFGEVDAGTFATAAEHAASTGRPLLSFLRSGGTRLQEGVAGLVGLSRATLAATRLAEAGVPHFAVVDQPTTGGVWVTVASRADLRCAVAGATVGFAGPRVVTAATGIAPDASSHTAEAALAAGHVDVVAQPDQVEAWLATALAAVTAKPSHARTVVPPDAATPGVETSSRRGWEQVQAARAPGRPAAGPALDALAPRGVELAGGDPAVRARLGLLADAPDTGVVAVALAAAPGAAPGPAGFRLLERAARLAGRLGLPLVTFVDTPGADPSPAAEAGGVAAAIGAAMGAVLACPSPTVCVVVGEGGSGGALAAACVDVLLMAPDSYLTALAPEGAATTLRIPAERAADLGGLRPADLRRLGFAEGVLGSGEAAGLAAAASAALDTLHGSDLGVRLSARRRKWSTGLPGRL